MFPLLIDALSWIAVTPNHIINVSFLSKLAIKKEMAAG